MAPRLALQASLPISAKLLAPNPNVLPAAYLAVKNWNDCSDAVFEVHQKLNSDNQKQGDIMTVYNENIKQ